MTESLSAQLHRLSHLDIAKLAHSNLTRVNQALFGKLLHHRRYCPRSTIPLQKQTLLAECINIDLHLSVFPRADSHSTKGSYQRCKLPTITMAICLSLRCGGHLGKNSDIEAERIQPSNRQYRDYGGWTPFYTEKQRINQWPENSVHRSIKCASSS